jgi:protease-4
MEGLKKLFLPVTATLAFIQNHFKALLFILIIYLIFAPDDKKTLTPNNLQHIILKGPIFDATDVVEEIEEARKDDSIRGVLFEVDSPGGAVAPSIEVAYALKRLKENKPVIVYASGMLTSGGYYASIWADEIIANPGSMIGSIGVIMQGANLNELMEKIGIKSQVIKAGKYKQVGTPDREWTPDERNELNKVIQDTYAMFIDDVAGARGLDRDNSPDFADAHIFTARQAKNIGLVDSIGVRFEAKKRVSELSGVKNPVWNKEDKFDRFMHQLGMESILLLHTYFPVMSLR